MDEDEDFGLNSIIGIGWSERLLSSKLDMGDSFIDIGVHHDGKFRYDGSNRELKYVNGKVEVFKKEDIDYFSWFHIKDFVCDLEYKEVGRIQWLLSGRNLGEGLRSLNSDQTSRETIGMITTCKSIDIYLEGCVPFEPDMVPLDASYMKNVQLEGVSNVPIYDDEIDVLNPASSEENIAHTEDDNNFNSRRSREDTQEEVYKNEMEEEENQGGLHDNNNANENNSSYFDTSYL